MNQLIQQQKVYFVIFLPFLAKDFFTAIHFYERTKIICTVDAYSEILARVRAMIELSWRFVWWSGLPAVYVIYYLTAVVRKPKVICGDKRLRKAIREHCPIFFEPYWPPLWAFNNHVMTILRAKLQRNPTTHYKRY